MTEQNTAAETTRADVFTDRPARYGKQLASHLGRRMGGEWSDADSTGWISFGDAGHAALSCSAGALHLVIEGTDLDRLEDVVGRHLVRFGTRDELRVEWVRADGSAGSVQVLAEEPGEAGADAAG